MQMIPTAMPGADAGAPQSSQPAAAPSPGAGAGLIFPELLKQAAAPAPQKPLVPGTPGGTTASTQSGEAPGTGIAAEGGDLIAAVDTLWADLSELAFKAQEAFQSAPSLGAKIEVMEGFVAELQTQMAAFQSASLGMPASLSTQITTELTQRTTLQFGLGSADLDGPMQALETAMGLLRSALPAAPQAGATPSAAVQQAAAPATLAETPAAAPVAVSAGTAETPAAPLMAATPEAAAEVPNPAGAAAALQSSAKGAVPTAAAAGQPDAAAAAEPASPAPLAAEPRVSPQGEEQPLAAARETPKAALSNVTFTSEAPKPAGQAPAVVQAVAPSAPPAASADAASALSAEAPAAATSRASADLAPAFSFARNIAAQVRGTVFEEGKTRVELTPRGLGDIEVEVARDDSGKLRVVLRAENAAVLTAFRNDRDMILGMLREGGVAVDDGEVAFESFGGHASYDDQAVPQPIDEIEGIGTAALMPEEAPIAARSAMRSDAAPTGALDITT